MSAKRLIKIFQTDDRESLEAFLQETDDVELTLERVPEKYSLLLDSPPILSVAAFFGATNCFHLLALSGADLEHTDNKNRYPVHFAVMNGKSDIFNILDSFSIDFTVVDSNKVGCLHYASQFGCFDVVQQLWQRNFSIDLKDSFGLTPVHYSAFSKESTIIEFYKSKGAKLNENSHYGTPFCIAVKFNSIEVVKYLIDQNINPNQFINEDETALMYSIRNNYEEIAQYIIKSSKDIDQKNGDGWTALHQAASRGQINMCQFLIENDADINATTFFGATPLLLAKNGNYDELTKYLEKNGASLRVNNKRFFEFSGIDV
ncbi:hypothetical protein TRFO_09713 [Tritrichomonas foetus]|uniref:Uncharacterized protein n=1 Tax=Tritrichomonas foetus TaxID=1144522 RepID=A0A1J4JGR8_9EUKA|nr:hypothetical protein TRFO_09713 [Tritrichomonas foetus]|eukprot:OHS96827.1 hypothetical protein TRFO_09713 [Tritrichomonas foetus]